MIRAGTDALELYKDKGKLELCSSSLPKVRSHGFSLNLSKNSFKSSNFTNYKSYCLVFFQLTVTSRQRKKGLSH